MSRLTNGTAFGFAGILSPIFRLGSRHLASAGVRIPSLSFYQPRDLTSSDATTWRLRGDLGGPLTGCGRSLREHGPRTAGEAGKESGFRGSEFQSGGSNRLPRSR